MSYRPPFRITNNILTLVQDISKALGFLSGAKLRDKTLCLRKSNKIKTIQSSLSIEGNSLTVEQITDVLEGKRILAPKKDIEEAKNAIKVYDNLKNYDPLSIKSLLEAHKIMMGSLMPSSGKWRSSGVGIIQGEKVAHVAPPAKRVSILMEQLFSFLHIEKEISWTLKACIFHYELEFIHPFTDGNGRIGRLWQQLILMKEDSIYEYLPIETLIKNNQLLYYEVLGKCDQEGEATLFIEFMLERISEILSSYNRKNVSQVNTLKERLYFAKDYFKDKKFTRKEYILLHKDISTATASRDLVLGVSKRYLKKNGQKNQTQYRFM